MRRDKIRQSFTVQNRRRVGRRIRQLRQAKGWTLARLARRVGVHLSQIQKIERGVSIGSLPVVLKIADALEVDLNQILGLPVRIPDGQGPKRMLRLLKQTIRQLSGDAEDPIPLLSHYPQKSNVENGIYLPELVEAFLPRPKDLKDPAAFGIKLKGKNMEPRFQEGDILIISPNSSLKNNIAVVYHLRSGAFGLAVYRQSGSELIILASSNLDAGGIQVFKPDDFAYIYPIVMSQRKEY